MNIALFLLSAYEEYPNKHICRNHWNYQWRGRRGTHFKQVSKIKLRKESFGGLLQNSDGKIYRLDDEGYVFIKKMIEGKSFQQTCDELSIKKNEAMNFKEYLDQQGVFIGDTNRNIIRTT